MKMKSSSITFLFMIGIPILSMAQLEQHRWQDRIILIFADSDQQKDFQEQWLDLQKDTTGLKERDLVVYRIFDQLGDEKLTPTDVRQLRKRYHSDQMPFKVLLIGKDGGIKAQQSSPIPRSDFFALIDGMPMRRAEIRRGKSKDH
ncbi:MAG: hypothetical protein Sapg2KO_10820 [Saprospiraceae bacterium]